MCGIVGYIGNQAVQDILLHGLEKLEYRGYDSAGIYVVDHTQKGHLFKAIGRIDHLKQVTDFSVPATIGIGHTRWATHGVPSYENTHPHQSPSGRLMLVHNGVIENYKQLKETYLQEVALQGQTDSEVVVAVIEHLMNTKQLSVHEAFRQTLQQVHGSYAFALIDNENPQTLYAAKNKSPLLIGLGDGFNVVCSDAMATIQLTDQYIDIQDGELITLTEHEVTLERLDGTRVTREPYTATLDLSDLEKGTYPYYMLKEIDEQPAVLRKIIQAYQNESGQLDIPQDVKDSLLAADRIHIVACGTSYHAGMVGKYYLEQLAGIPTEVHIASEFSYNTPLLTGKPLFLFITQSGETADSRQVLVKVNQLNYPSLTITNVAGSTLSREAHHTLLLHAGPEIAVASTKAYTAQIAVLAIIAEALATAKGCTKQLDMVRELSLVANAMATVTGEKERIHQLAKQFLTDQRNAFFIGRGLDYYVALEAALKLKEISYIQTEGFAAGELKHGTIALIEEGTPVFALISEHSIAAHTRGNVEEVRARGAHVCTFVDEKLAQADDQFVLPHVHPTLAPLLNVIPTQLLAYFATLERGYDIDKPRNLAKSVTVE